VDDPVRLVYVEGSFAWFASKPGEACGDDWNDAPHDCNASPPYAEAGGRHVKVAYDGDLEIAGTQSGSYAPYHPPAPKYGLSVDEINEGAAPWLYQPSYGHPQFPKPLLVIPALVTLPEFQRLVTLAGGVVYQDIHSR
jgi:hypothetical protein